MSPSQNQSLRQEPAVAADPAAIQSVDQLVQARELRGLALSELAARLGMVPRQIQAIERGDWRALPGRSFARSALRAYGRAVSVNVESLLVAIDAEYGVEGEPINRPALDQPMPRRGVLGFAASGSGNWFTWSALILAGLIVIAFFFGGGASLLDLGDSGAGSSASPATGSAASPEGSAGRTAGGEPAGSSPSAAQAGVAGGSATPGSTSSAVVIAAAPLPGGGSSNASGAAISTASASSLGSGAAQQSAGATSAGGTATALGTTPASPPTPLGAGTPAAQPAPTLGSSGAPVASASGVSGDERAAPSSSSGLVLRFAGDSWIEIRDAADRVVATGTQPAGTTRSFDLAPPLSGVIGNVGAVAVTWRGAPFDLSPFLRQGVARFRIERGDQ